MRTKKEELIPARELMEEIVGPLTFARFLRVWRELQDMTQVAAAAKLGVTKARLSDLEHGRRLASVELARSIAKRLGAPETQAIECCLQDQLRKAKVPKLRVKLVA
ncbi:MAG: helix-turn-helix transcriptional regulator [Deltaproteobacteria bacterium]|nr:helix-turn-helix transcriptional regulator [Deltaproteobacteria bacterium]